jgi:propanol-preferring alcohol dehydrogenase
MKAARLYPGASVLTIDEVEKPKLQNGHAIIKIRAAGVCATETHFVEGLIPVGSPLVLGHEIAGDIDQIDPVYKTDLKVGNRVAVYNMMTCGSCFNCRNDMENMCTQSAGQLGFSADGGFEEYVQVPIRSLVTLPPNVTYEEGAVHACSGMTAVHSTRLAGTKIGDVVGVHGVGGVGLMCIQVAKISGAKVIAIADTPEKAVLAKEIGAEEAIVCTGYSALAEQIKSVTHGAGLDVVYDLVGSTEGWNAAIDSLACRGRLIIIGYRKEDKLNFYPVGMLLKEGQILTCVAGCKRDLELSLRYANEGRITTVVSNRIPLEKVNEAIQMIIERKVKGRSVIVFDPR